jgi:long-chain acyl-CoA synthetase
LTGATGKLGRCLIEELALSGSELTVLVRARSPEAARDRVRGAFSEDSPGGPMTVLCGDVTEPKLGLGRRDRARLLSSVDIVVHAAATTTFSLSLEAARGVNVTAADNVLALAAQAPRLQRVVHVSTAFVAGKRTGRILESELEHDRGFQNGYQQSKYEAELVVRRYRERLPVTVVRPSILLDADGPVASPCRSAFRFALELVKRGILPALPGSASTPVDLVMEMDAARTIAKVLSSAPGDETYHVAGGERSPTLGSIVEPFWDVRYLEIDQFAWQVAKWTRERPRLAHLFDQLEGFIYDLAYPKLFDTTRIEAALGGPVVTEDPLAAILAPERAVANPLLLGAGSP